jgi:hypothetical protein
MVLDLERVRSILGIGSLGYVVGIRGINGYIMYIIVLRKFSFVQARLLLLAALLINFYMQFLFTIKLSELVFMF